MSLIQEGVAGGHRTWVMVWCMLAADAIRRCDCLDGDSWVLGDVRLGGVPSSYLTSLIEISRVFKGNPCDRVEVAYLLFRFVTADPLLVKTVTRLLAATPPKAPNGTLSVPTTIMIKAAGHLGTLSHDQLTIAHDLAATWLDGSATLAAEAKIRSRS